MATSVMMKSRHNLFVWELDTNYGPTLPTMLSRNWITYLVSWRKSELLNPSKSTSTQLGILSPFLLLCQTAPLTLWPSFSLIIIWLQSVLSRTYSNSVHRQLLQALLVLLLVMLCFIFQPRPTKNLSPRKASSSWCYFTSVATLISRQHSYWTSFQPLHQKECR